MDNIDNYVVSLNVSIKSWLQFQLNIPRNHLSEIESHFGKTEDIPSEKPDNKSLKRNDWQFVKHVTKITHHKAIKRQLLLTDDRADRYRLETIFNVQF